MAIRIRRLYGSLSTLGKDLRVLPSSRLVPFAGLVKALLEAKLKLKWR
jgi:hypothetical protein